MWVSSFHLFINEYGVSFRGMIIINYTACTLSLPKQLFNDNETDFLHIEFSKTLNGEDYLHGCLSCLSFLEGYCQLLVVSNTGSVNIFNNIQLDKLVNGKCV